MNPDQITIADLQAKAVELAKEHGVSVVIEASAWATVYQGDQITQSVDYRIHAIEKACVNAPTLDEALSALTKESGIPAMLARAEKLEAEAARLRVIATTPEGVEA